MTRGGMRAVISRRNLSAFIIILLIGVLHRAAETSPWADDRLLAADPAWLQFSSPHWHSSLAGSFSIASALTRAFDPLTSASPSGDARGIAAVLTALAALMLLAVFRRLGVCDVLSFWICFGLVVPVLPTPPATAVAHAIQILVSAAMLFVSASMQSRTGRLAALAALTVVGAVNHAGAVVFAAGLWTAEIALMQRRGRIASIVPIAVLAVTVGIVASAAVLQRASIFPPASSDVAAPRLADLTVGLLTGQLDPPQQPAAQGTLRDAIWRSLPAPVVLFVPLAILGVAASNTRRVAFALALSSGGVVAWMANTWVTDLAIAAASARIALLALVGLGLSWLWTQRLAGAKPLALLAAAIVVLTPFLTRVGGTTRAATAEMDSFSVSAPLLVGDGYWSADRLSTARALLAGGSAALLAHRVEANARGFARAPADARVIAFSGLSRQQIALGV